MDQNQQQIQQIQAMDKTNTDITIPDGSPGSALENPSSKEASLADSGGGQPLFCKDKDKNMSEESSQSSNLTQLTFNEGLFLSKPRLKSNSFSALTLSGNKYEKYNTRKRNEKSPLDNEEK